MIREDVRSVSAAYQLVRQPEKKSVIAYGAIKLLMPAAAVVGRTLKISTVQGKVIRTEN